MGRITDRKTSLVLSVPPDFREWVVSEAGARRQTISEFALGLMSAGLRAGPITEILGEFRAVGDKQTAPQLEALRQILALRYLAEAEVKKASNTPATVSTDANAYADRELARLGFGGNSP